MKMNASMPEKLLVGELRRADRGVGFFHAGWLSGRLPVPRARPTGRACCIGQLQIAEILGVATVKNLSELDHDVAVDDQADEILIAIRADWHGRGVVEKRRAACAENARSRAIPARKSGDLVNCAASGVGVKAPSDHDALGVI